MGKFKDLTGLTFNNQKVLKRVGQHPTSGGVIWQVECLLCSRIYESRSDGIQFQNKGCGCTAGYRTHGLTRVETRKFYNTWRKMNQRCYDATNQRYKSYGERGIRVCDEWLGEEGLIRFVEWALRTCSDQSLTLERKLVSGNYCPENCEWKTWDEQARNKEKTIWVQVPYMDKPICMKEASRLPECRVGYEAAFRRVKTKGWDPYTALITPPIKNGKKR